MRHKQQIQMQHEVVINKSSVIKPPKTIDAGIVGDKIVGDDDKSEKYHHRL